MRCVDLNALLDQDPIPLSRKEWRQAEHHLAHCPKCTEAWDIYLHCVALPIPQTPPDLAARITERIDRVTPGRARSRSRRATTMITGGFLLAGAALATSVWYLERSSSSGPTPAADHQAGQNAASQSASTGEASGAVERHGGASGETPFAAPSADSAAPAGTAIGPSAGVSVDMRTVLVLPSRSRSDPRLAALVDDVVAALRTTDGINVVGPEHAMAMIAAGVPEERVAEFLGAGHVLQLELPIDGATFANARMLDGASGLDVAFLNVMSVERITNDDWSRQADSIAGFVHERFDPAVREAETAAARAAVLNTALDDSERVTALMRLPRSIQDGVWTLPEGVIVAVADMATATLDPSTRALVWRALKGTRHPYLIEPLLQSLRSDADSDVRTAAAAALEDFFDEPEVRDALVRTRDTDVSAEVRARAAEALLTDSERRRIAREEFLDAARPPAARLRSMLEYARLGPVDDDVAAAMIDFAQTDASPSRRGMAWQALGRFGHSAFMEPLLGALRSERDTAARASVVFGLAGYLGDPRVRERLSAARDEDPEFDVRRAAAAVLRGDFP